ncbi:MAG: hypothetical protein HN353_05955 [Bdellovibrionales bacterium]|nr:hypothetical protein [Bdellovibrionales bacterium]MBT3527065.1 hypothetical protein [Bdellovibrionales bacterium]MBT7668718.1 hypothetical protein [Bdellovibrionales bacterium]MBT7766471.1 hypothetical protein [Bdellovibrionales bacterium]
MVKQTSTLQEINQLSFKQWICFSENSQLWGRGNTREFENFWHTLFPPNVNFRKILSNLDQLTLAQYDGPLYSWSVWLKERFIIYCFIGQDCPLLELAQVAKMEVTTVATIIRDFLVHYHPEPSKHLSSYLQVGSILSPNRNIRFSKLPIGDKKLLRFDPTAKDHLMFEVELTASDSWPLFYQQSMRKLCVKPYLSRSNLNRVTTNKFMMVLLEIILLLALGTAILTIVQHANVWYEKYLIDKISIYEPQLLWLDKTLSFKEVTPHTEIGDTEPLKRVDIDKVLANNLELPPELKADVERSGTESEVVLTSLQTLPRDFDTADLEQSGYEESTQGGYRDTRYGRKRVYRIMVKSIDPDSTIEKINTLLQKYTITPVGEVRPGMAVPGGFYFNLFAPKRYVKEFLTEVKDSSDSVIFESMAKGRSPQGKEHVFIWVKSI